MRYKVAPPARSRSFLETARDAVPLVPDSEADCCRAIQTATDVSDRETAREYLVFLQALGLVAESERGYYRTRTDLDRAALARAFEDSVFGVDVLLGALGPQPVAADAAFDALRSEVPRWERERHADWEAIWLERVTNLLEWATTFGLVEKTADGYRQPSENGTAR
ncbi:hypothetical protein SAMN05443574_10542 [Haloarcula vallismortis]|uniref:Uncharacterized protein n=2 Tax=Haloarcula vallismortis TaxID=28442 RepID=M0JF43_HALVA|nr:hypothetical protein [Haloarcula vallismortis]EMA06619.1 hypothetical protein C437_10953 [Haloarcula vallismortis ATCC 29715]SDW61332.1 hypothetical protein SAMN05443574_10542 [Haloarcula vallismortis]